MYLLENGKPINYQVKFNYPKIISKIALSGLEHHQRETILVTKNVPIEQPKREFHSISNASILLKEEISNLRFDSKFPFFSQELRWTIIRYETPFTTAFAASTLQPDINVSKVFPTSTNALSSEQLHFICHNIKQINPNDLSEINNIEILLADTKMVLEEFRNPPYSSIPDYKDLLLLMKVLEYTTFIPIPDDVKSNNKLLAESNTEIIQTLGLKINRI